MDFKTFVAEIYPTAIHSLYVRSKTERWSAESYRHPKQGEVTEETLLRGERVNVGGVSGGSCYDGSDARPYVNHDAKPATFEILDEILEKICPEISHLKYLRLQREAKVTQDSVTEHEYYGNAESYVFMQVTLGDLFTAMQELKLLKMKTCPFCVGKHGSTTCEDCQGSGQVEA